MAKSIIDGTLPVSVPKFDERHYLGVNAQAKEAIKSATVSTALDHYLRHGIDENRYSLIRREATTLAGSIDRFLVSESGFCLLIGWLADEGCDPPQFRLIGGEFSVELPVTTMYRHARPDVEGSVKSGAYDYGFVLFGQSPSKSLLKQSVLFQVTSIAGAFQAKVTPELVSNKRLMDTLLHRVGSIEAHAGKEITLHSFLAGPAGASLVELFRTYVAASTTNPYVERFRSRKVRHSFVTVLFGSTEPVKLQPMLFSSEKVDFGEWIYVCNSPEDADEILSYAHLMSDLYDVMVTVIVMGANAGFGAANNIAIEHAAGERIFLINPDVHVFPAYAGDLQHFLANDDWGTSLWGGLLFYNEHILMHSGMYVARDAFVRRNSLNWIEGPAALPSHCQLLRVEHFEKSVPIDERDWREPKKVMAVSGALMAFGKTHFEKLGGFSTRYVYGHYEDADLSLRWAKTIGAVAVHPQIRLIHLEGQGSKVRGEEFRGAAIANRHFFTTQFAELFNVEQAKPARRVNGS